MTTKIGRFQSFISNPFRAFTIADLLSFLLFLSVVIVLQFAGGAYGADFGGNSDEGGHYVTGLMIRDYIAGGHLTSPMRFAENYYLHYPKVALGHWPPFFYLIQSAWTLPFSPSRISIILLMAILTALLAFALYRVVRTEFGTKAGVVAGLLLVSLPLVQTYDGMVMADIPVTLLIFLATISFGQYLESERLQHAITFGVLSSLAILTKGSGSCLALLPAIALIVSRRFHLLSRASFWCPAIIVLVLCAPWYYLTRDMAFEGFLYPWGLEYTSLAVPHFFRELLNSIGFGLALLGVVGFVVCLVRTWRQKGSGGTWAAAAALLFSVLIIQSVIPAGLDDRFVIPALPALVMFIVAGAVWLSARLPLKRLTASQKAWVIVVLAVVVYVGETFAIPRNTNHGFTAVARSLLARPEFKNSVFMVSSDSSGEGAFISEVARLEQRPGHFVLRALKVLSRNRWGDAEDKLRFETPDEVMDWLNSVPVGILVVDLSPEAMRLKHHLQLVQMINQRPQVWELLGSFPGVALSESSRSEIRVYRLIGHESRPAGKIKLDMNYMLNRSIEN